MGEVVLRKVQAGVEVTRGTAVAATKKLNGTMAITRQQGRRYAVEDRGSFTDKYRANPKLIEAGFTLQADATFEDMPLFAATFLNGGASQTGSSTVGYTWAINPDTTDGVKTLTYEAGDDTVAWQGAFGVTDSVDFTLALDDALSMNMQGFVQDWLPQTTGSLTTSFAGFTGALSDRVVESVMGYQNRLYIDNTGTAAGTTAVTGRFIHAQWGIKNQNKRKYFGDGTALFTKMGRGRRQVNCQVTFEALDTAQYADFYNAKAKVLRLTLGGTAITGTTFGTTNGAITAGTTVTAITTTALTAAIPGGTCISVGGVTFTVTIAGAALNAVSVPVQSQVIQQTINTGSTVLAARTQSWDFYGQWETFSLGNRDTNTTFQFNLMDVYDATAAKEMALTVVNGQTAL